MLNSRPHGAAVSRKVMACLVLLGAAAVVASLFGERLRPVSAAYLGTTNDYYAAFTVTNRTAHTLAYAGGRLQLETGAGWKEAPGRFRRIGSFPIDSNGTGTVCRGSRGFGSVASALGICALGEEVQFEIEGDSFPPGGVGVAAGQIHLPFKGDPQIGSRADQNRKRM